MNLNIVFTFVHLVQVCNALTFTPISRMRSLFDVSSHCLAVCISFGGHILSTQFFLCTFSVFFASFLLCVLFCVQVCVSLPHDAKRNSFTRIVWLNLVPNLCTERCRQRRRRRRQEEFVRLPHVCRMCRRDAVEKCKKLLHNPLALAHYMFSIVSPPLNNRAMLLLPLLPFFGSN